MADRPSIFTWIFVLAGLVILVLGAFHFVDFSNLLGESAPQLFLYLLIAIGALHIIEAIIAFNLAKKQNKNALFWAAQTLLLGAFSLRFLLKPQG